jgi:Zn-dependent protease with chaperone function
VGQRLSGTLANAVAPGVRPEHIEPLQTRIARNRRRFVMFMVAFTTALAAGAALTVGFAATLFALLVIFRIDPTLWSTLAEPAGFVASVSGITFVITLAASWSWALVRLAEAEHRLVERRGARGASGGALLATKSALRDMAIAAGLPHTPQLYLIDTDTVNAFVVGRTYERARIGVTRGFVERIPIDEQRAVFANLVSRVLSLDTLWATAVSAIMGPVWALRDFDLGYEAPVTSEPHRDESGAIVTRRTMRDDRVGCLPVYGLAVLVSEALAWYHYEAAWRANEKADAEGMMLLKDPRSMVRAIEHVLERNNHVPSAGDAYSQLFYCWAGFGFAPEDDPEMRRVARLREVLGAEGAPFVPRPNVPDWPGIPPAPRLELDADEEVNGPGGAS